MPSPCLRRTRRRIEHPFDRAQKPWPRTGRPGPVLVLRTLLHTYQVFAGPEGIDEARAIVIDLDVSQPGRYRN